MKQEPVAWSCWNEDMVDLPAVILFTEPNKYEWQSIKPLYTAPQTKPLSDEEIEYYEHLIAKLFNCSTTQKVIGLDRVIRAIEERHGIK